MATAEEMDHGRSKQKSLLTEPAIRKMWTKSPTDLPTETRYLQHFSIPSPLLMLDIPHHLNECA
jgi:hypothetical protein